MKKQTKNFSSRKVGILSALFAVLFMVFACGEGSNTSINESGSQNNDVQSQEVYTVVEELPQYPGGVEALFKYIVSEIKYPKEAINKGIEGQVLVQFVIERDGSISNVQAVEGIGAGCENAAISALQAAPSFKPGSQRGRTVRVRRELPIIFQLSNEDKSKQGIVISREINKIDFKLKVDAIYANGDWSGTIYDEDTGKVLPGANIVVAGTTLGTVSDLDGTFSVEAKHSKDIVVSFVGYQSLKLEGK